jgi:hypothetical protein
MVRRATEDGRSAADAAAIDWLLEFGEPAIRGMTRRDLLDQKNPSDLHKVLEGPLVRALFAGQHPDGSFGVDWYRKWTGAQWRLVSLVELEVPAGERRAVAAAETLLEAYTARDRLSRVRTVGGLARSHASMEGNVLAIAARLGMARDPRAAAIAQALLAWQWPDGGWNCDNAASGRRSSFHETLAAMWGLHEYSTATGDSAAADAAARAAELFLDHRIFRRHGTGEPIHRSWVVIHYPPYWHYDVLQAMTLLTRMGLASDERARDAVELVETLRRPDGCWHAGAKWWSPPGGRSGVEVLDWTEAAVAMATLNAMRVLKAVGRFGAP